jgi:hypothetical protein
MALWSSGGGDFGGTLKTSLYRAKDQEPGQWVILPCMLEADDCYFLVDVYPDGRVEASDDFRFSKADFYGPDYMRFAAIYNAYADYMIFMKRPVELTDQGTISMEDMQRLANMARKW